MKKSKHVFTEKVVSLMEDIGKVDIVVGIPSRNTEEMVAHVMCQAEAGLKKYFPNKKGVIIVSDSSGEKSKTFRVIKKAQKGSDLPVVLIEMGKGKGNQVYAILEAANYLRCEALCLFDADLKSIKPEWVKNVAEPILSRQFDFVTPNYIRHKYDGTITNSIVYPLSAALYGLEIRQPIGGDFGLSKKLIRHSLSDTSWDDNVGYFGIDIWLTTLALCDFRRVAQANLGVKIHDASVKDPKYPEKSVGAMFGQVVGAMFSMIEKHVSCWRNEDEIYHAPYYGPEIHMKPQKVDLNFDYLYDASLRTAKEEMSFWEKELDKKLLKKIKNILGENKEKFDLPQALWADIIYEFIILYHKKRKAKDKEKVVCSLIPIYLARAASLSREIKDYTNQEAEAKFHNLMRLFQKKKKDFIVRWDKESTITGLHMRKKIKEVVGLE